MLSVQPFDSGTAGEGLTFAGGVPVRLSPSAARLLAWVEGGATFAEVAVECRRRGQRVCAAEVEAAYRSLKQQIEGLAAAAPQRRPPAPLWGARRLLSATTVGRWSRPLGCLFTVGWAVPLLGLAVGCLAALAQGGDGVAGLGGLSFLQGLVAYLLFALSLLVHELGHAAAGARFGVEPGEIGAAVYLIFPAFFCDVTAVWPLRRRQRVVVDLGGIYLQLLMAGMVAALALVTGSPSCHLAALLMVASGVWNLLPFGNLDGQWLLADLLGVPELARLPGRLLRRLFGGGGGKIAAAPRRRYSLGLRWGLGVYAALALGVWGLLGVALAQRLVWGLSHPGLGGFLVLLPSLPLLLPLVLGRLRRAFRRSAPVGRVAPVAEGT
jgi:putative peptide zinc metalloprotease protein